MKTLKYRSIFAAFTAVALSVFLFTSCEKESDGTAEEPGNRLEKFQRLQFNTGSTSTSTNSGSGTFIGTGGSSLSFIPPSDGGDVNFSSPESGSSMGFTDPKSTGPNFTVDRSFGQGGGTFTLDGEDYEMGFAFCADFDFTETFDSDSTDEDKDVNIFIGIAGDFSLDGDGDSDDLGIDAYLYVFSYGGATDIGSFDSFEEDDSDGDFAYVIAVTFEDDGSGSTTSNFYFGTSGSVAFTGGEVLLSGVRMAEVEMGDDSNGLGSRIVDASANLQCVEYPNPQGEE